MTVPAAPRASDHSSVTSRKATALDLASLTQQIPELAERLLLVRPQIAGHHQLGAGPVGPRVLAAGVRADQERAMDDLDVVLDVIPGNAGGHQADRRRLAVVIS